MSPRLDRRSGLSLPSQLRGVYHRVAQRLRVDPSYVSRVANGQRRSKHISKALQREIQRSLRELFALERSPSLSAAVLRSCWQKQQRVTATQLINNILDTILVFAHSASIAAPDSDAKHRCLMSAYNSHNDVRSLLGHVTVSKSDARKIQRKLDLAEAALHQAALHSSYVFGNLNKA